MIQKKFILLLVFLATEFLACKKKDTEYIPNVAVDIYIYTTDPLFFNLQVTGGWEYVTGGSRGILVYRKSNEEFMAFDRHCPYQPSNTCGQVEVDFSTLAVVDSCCGSQFSIQDGAVVKSPASMPLKPYMTEFDGTVLHILN